MPTGEVSIISHLRIDYLQCTTLQDLWKYDIPTNTSLKFNIFLYKNFVENIVHQKTCCRTSYVTRALVHAIPVTRKILRKQGLVRQQIQNFKLCLLTNSWKDKANYYLLNPLSANPTKWSSTLKQFVGFLPKNCLSMFDHFVGLAFKRLRNLL